MADVYDIDKYKNDKDSNKDFIIIEELPIELQKKYNDLTEENLIDFDIGWNEYRIYDEKFIYENLESLVHGTVPNCTICGGKLSKGDLVDNLWPIEFGYNICQSCLKEIPESHKEQRLVNLENIKKILVEEDYKKVIKSIKDKDILEIKGNRIITEEKFLNIRKDIQDDK